MSRKNFKMNIIGEELTCKQCRQIYDEPVTLNCCGESVCKKHIEQLLSTSSVDKKFACLICNADNTKNRNNSTFFLIKIS